MVSPLLLTFVAFVCVAPLVRYLTFCPSAVLVAPLFERLFQAATACLPLQEHFAARAVLTFFKGVFGGGKHEAGASKAVVSSVIASQGATAIKGMLFAAADTAPPSLFSALAGPLTQCARRYVTTASHCCWLVLTAASPSPCFVGHGSSHHAFVAHRYPSIMQAGFVATVQAPNFPGRRDAWAEASKGFFLQLLQAARDNPASTINAVPGGADEWYAAVFRDFALISRGKSSAQVLQAHVRSA